MRFASHIHHRDFASHATAVVVLWRAVEEEWRHYQRNVDAFTLCNSSIIIVNNEKTLGKIIAIQKVHKTITDINNISSYLIKNVS